MRISDWSSDVCSSDLLGRAKLQLSGYRRSEGVRAGRWREACAVSCRHSLDRNHGHGFGLRPDRNSDMVTMAAVKIGRRLGRVGRAVVILFREVLATADRCNSAGAHAQLRSEEHKSELQSLMRISYAVFCLK